VRNETAFSDLERSAIRRALAQANGNKRDAAELLGVSRATLYRKMARLDVRT
jgi:transcriptional regulator of acetoin/glycerol metabolism